MIFLVKIVKSNLSPTYVILYSVTLGVEVKICVVSKFDTDDSVKRLRFLIV